MDGQGGALLAKGVMPGRAVRRHLRTPARKRRWIARISTSPSKPQLNLFRIL
ncbi:hypothetical protein PD5205_03707 [Xanthomonas fragariae]|uniref:Uncharacterized protein n=1 Tax=Xanthomonas fragariae TaxID=48664 RepID=A0A1Y6HN78_9XANT|nr:hypothetical protein PD885_00287 [Xanthomonas fragariae]SMR04979.1 hypothetical protein PD5205_03707 [Xanthomonas fragariae]